MCAALVSAGSFRYHLGVDGGGTGTRVRWLDASGHVGGEGHSGPSGLGQGVAQAWRHIAQAVERAFAAAGLAVPPASELALGLGLAGAERASARESFLSANPGFGLCSLHSDGHTTLEGAFAGGPGMVLAVGTGSIGLAQCPSGHRVRVGGWGFPVGDEGGGAWLGLRALQLTQQALDGRRPSGPLADAIGRRAGGSPSALIEWTQAAGQHACAELAPLVFQAADEADADAQCLLAEAVVALEAHVSALDAQTRSEFPLPLALMGGVGRRLRERLAPAVQRRCVEPLGDSVDGALALLQRGLAAGSAELHGRASRSHSLSCLTGSSF